MMATLLRGVFIIALSSALAAQRVGSNSNESIQPANSVSQEIGELRAALSAQQQQFQRALAEQQQQLRQLQQIVLELKQEMAARDSAGQSKAVAIYPPTATGQLQTASGRALGRQEAAAGSASDPQQDSPNLATLASAEHEDRKRISAMEGVLGRFRISGDIRLRGDSILQSYSGCATCDPRNQERIRLRLGIEGKLNQDFAAGIYFASGAQTNPISTNETLTNFFERKTVGFDRGWIAYQPQAHKWLQLTGGKFAYTWLRSSLTLDPDLNPEGASEKFSFDVSRGPLKNVTLTGIQLFFNEIPKPGTFTTANSLSGNTPLPRPVPFSAHDGFAIGGQLSAVIHPTDWLTLTSALTALNWQNTDSIAQSIAALSSPAGNALTNATVNQSVVLNGKTVSVPIGYRSKFLYEDALLDSTVKTPWTRFPFHLLLDYVQNGRAVSHNKRGYWAEGALGALQEKNDVQFGYSWGRIEQDAVLAAFNESEMRAGTNLLQNRIFFGWQVERNVSALFSTWIGRTLDSNLQNASLAPGLKRGQQDPYLKRLQLDLLYRF